MVATIRLAEYQAQEMAKPSIIVYDHARTAIIIATRKVDREV